VWGPDTVASPLHEHPVRAHAVITDLYIDGFGGDEVADYKYKVDGHTYFGSGRGGELGNGDIFSHNPGDAISIEYAATRPSLSCTCNASAHDSEPSVHDRLVALPLALVLILPVAWMGTTSVRRTRRRGA
jgi:hypothetical protein